MTYIIWGIIMGIVVGGLISVFPIIMFFSLKDYLINHDTHRPDDDPMSDDEKTFYDRLVPYNMQGKVTTKDRVEIVKRNPKDPIDDIVNSHDESIT